MKKSATGIAIFPLFLFFLAANRVFSPHSMHRLRSIRKRALGSSKVGRLEVFMIFGRACSPATWESTSPATPTSTCRTCQEEAH
jgi:hypothetical protein